MINNPIILIVEDDATMLRGLSDNFRAAGFEVATASDGRAGLAHVLAQPPDLLLLDVMLPFVSGYDLCQQVRRAGLTFPILMLTAKAQEEEIVRGLELGADDYITKPFGIRELLARVNNLLRRGKDNPKSKVEVGEAVFDRSARRLTRHGKDIALTTKEYQLLDFFVANSHRALTRNEIMNQVWGRSIIVSSRSVDRCVATLRSKIEVEPSRPILIHTIRDVGYRFGEVDS